MNFNFQILDKISFIFIFPEEIIAPAMRGFVNPMAEYDMSAIPCKNPAMFGAKSTSKGIMAAD